VHDGLTIGKNVEVHCRNQGRKKFTWEEDVKAFFSLRRRGGHFQEVRGQLGSFFLDQRRGLSSLFDFWWHQERGWNLQSTTPSLQDLYIHLPLHGGLRAGHYSCTEIKKEIKTFSFAGFSLHDVRREGHIGKPMQTDGSRSYLLICKSENLISFFIKISSLHHQVSVATYYRLDDRIRNRLHTPIIPSLPRSI
jgi:hypothetical protein